MIKKNKFIERRKNPRFAFHLPLEIDFCDFHLKTETTNISCAGIFCPVDSYVPVQTKVNVKMKLSFIIDNKRHQRVVHCPAKITRIIPSKAKGDGHYDIGIEFLKIEEHDKDLIIKFIHQKNLKEAKELKKMYLELKEMAARLVELEESHPTAEHFRKVISGTISELDAAAHILDHEIIELRGLD